MRYNEAILTFKSRRLLPPLTRSPSLSEGGFYGGIDILANTPKVCIDLTVGEPYDFQIIAFKDFGAKFVFLFAFFGIVLRPVNFNNQFCFVTIKVCNKIVDCFLALKSHFVFRQKVVP